MFYGEILAFFAAATASAIHFGAWRAEAIVSKSDPKFLGKKLISGNNGDNQVSQSINRNYHLVGYGSNYDHGSNSGLNAHSTIGENYEGGYDFGYQSGHHHDDFEDSRHHHHHYPHHSHHLHQQHSHHHHQRHPEKVSERDGYGYHKALAIKGLLVPLAGVALLGAAAAFVSNPILLQLGVISGSYLGRRKRETAGDPINLMGIASSQERNIHLEEIKFLKKFVSQIPRREIEVQEKKMMASYLSCSGVTADEFCLERLTCELHSVEAASMPMEANVLSIIVSEILGNEFVPEEMKKRISKAIERGRNDQGCESYRCKALEDKRKVEMTATAGK